MPYGSLLHTSPTNYHLLAAKEEPYQKAYLFTKKYWRIFWKKSREWASRQTKRQDRKSNRNRQKNKRGDCKAESRERERERERSKKHKTSSFISKIYFAELWLTLVRKMTLRHTLPSFIFSLIGIEPGNLCSRLPSPLGVSVSIIHVVYVYFSTSFK